MDYVEKFNSALEYIENNLENEIDYDQLAHSACCSSYHFSRMFAALTGINLSEYIRRRRLSNAAFELQNTDAKIIEIAFRYGYDSPDSFARAFKKLHGINPLNAKEKGAQLKSFPKLTIQMQIKGVVAMEYRIEELDFSFTVAGKKEIISFCSKLTDFQSVSVDSDRKASIICVGWSHRVRL